MNNTPPIKLWTDFYTLTENRLNKLGQINKLQDSMCSTILLLLQNIYLCIEKSGESGERGENGGFSLFFLPF